MHTTIKTFTVAAGSDLSAAAALGAPCVDLIWCLSDGRLRTTGRPVGGGLMGLYTKGAIRAEGDLRPLTAELCRQLHRCRYRGVLLDLPETAEGYAFAARLSPCLSRLGVPCYLPAALADADPQAFLLLPSAISGGSYDEMLEHFLARFPAHRLCLELVRTRHDFAMPSPDADGQLLSAEVFQQLLGASGRHFFSPELCSNYFTYRAEDRSMHFVLFDDEETACRKLHPVRSHGFHAVFALYAEWGDTLPAIFRSLRE